jgi:uncharacterized protein
MMIIDAHVHLGDDRLHDSHRTEKELLSASKKAGIDCLIVQTAQSPSIEITRSMHDRLVKFMQANREQVYAIASVNPNYDLDIYFGELQRVIRDQGFIGMKIAPHTYSWNPLVQRGVVPFLAADTFDVPLMIHTGTGIPFSMPSSLYQRIKDFPHVRIILAHAGGHGLFIEETLWLAKQCPNVYLETSRGPNMDEIRRYVKELGAERVMFGSDSADEMEHSLWMYRNAGLSREEMEICFAGTAKEVFRIS